MSKQTQKSLKGTELEGEIKVPQREVSRRETMLWTELSSKIQVEGVSTHSPDLGYILPLALFPKH